MMTIRLLFAVVVLALCSLAQSSPHLPGQPCGYQFSYTNANPVNGWFAQTQTIRADNVATVTYNNGAFQLGSFIGGQIMWETYTFDPNLVWASISSPLPYIPIFNIDFYNASSPPTPWTVPASVNGANTFFLSTSAVTSPAQWASPSTSGSGPFVALFYNTLDVPLDNAFRGIEMMSQYVRYQSGAYIWSVPWLVRII